MPRRGRAVIILSHNSEHEQRFLTETRRDVPALLIAESRGIHGRVCFRGSRRQREVERRAAPAVAVGPNPAACRFDDRLTDCQAHAAALRLRRKKCVEYLVGLAQR